MAHVVDLPIIDFLFFFVFSLFVLYDEGVVISFAWGAEYQVRPDILVIAPPDILAILAKVVR